VSRWRHYNPNPAGRAVGDCAVRAIAAALGVDWEKAFAMIAANAFQMGDVISANASWGSVLRERGFKRHAISNNCPNCYTAENFAEDHPLGVYVLGFGNHVATVRDGLILDSWDSSQEIPEYYWSKE